MILEIKSRLAQLVAAFPRYAILAHKTTDEVLDQKGRDLGIRLFRGFRAQRWGGAGGPGGSKLALAELKQRTLARRGTRVRPSILRAMDAERQQLAVARIAISQGQAYRRLGAGHRAEIRANLRRRANLWRSAVGAEVRARGRGIGVLAASFLWFRRKFSRGRIEFVRNRSGSATLGYLERDDNALRIVGLREGLDVVDTRHSVIEQALADALADINVYLDRYTAAFAVAVEGSAA